MNSNFEFDFGDEEYLPGTVLPNGIKLPTAAEAFLFKGGAVIPFPDPEMGKYLYADAFPDYWYN